MTDLKATSSPSLALSDAFQAHTQRVSSGPHALPELRKRAFAKFQTLGWPTTKEETWRFTNPKPLSDASFQIAEPPSVWPAKEIGESYFLAETHRLVFVNGHFYKEWSTSADLPLGCTLQHLSEPGVADQTHVRQALKGFQNSAAQFGSLNTAFLDSGAVLHLASNTQLDKPLHILHINTATTTPHMVHPRLMVFAMANSSASIVETFLGPDSGSYWVNHVTQLHLAAGAQMKHYLVQFGSEQSFHTANFQARLEANSCLVSNQFLTGARLMRNNLNLHLLGEGSECEINGLTLGHNQQTLDNHIEMNHVAPHCNSRQYFKTILDDNAHGVFGGRVVVFQEAQKTDAQQTNRNLLLSENARIDTKPQLEIYADDVKCAHGATTGQIDEDALFYLASRGLDPKAAREVLLYAFAHEVLDRVEIQGILDQVEHVLLSRFSQRHLFGG